MARTVPLKLTYASRSGLVKGPQYTITEDPPWLQTSPQQSSSSAAAALPAEPRPSSTYSQEDRDVLSMVTESASPMASPHTPGFPPSSDAALSSSSSKGQDVVADASSSGQTRSTRLPIFKQVRSMLTSTRNPNGGANAMKWDEYSGEPSENGKERLGVKPSTYKSPYEGILKSRKQQSTPGSPDTQNLGSPRSLASRQFSPPSPDPQHLDSPHLLDSHARRLSPAGLSDPHARGTSPVSALVDDDMHALEQQDSHVNISPPDSRSVSPIMTYEQLRQMHDNSTTATSTVQRPRTTEGSGRVKRKPVAPTQFNDYQPAAADVRILPSSSHGESHQSEDPESRFSWTTAAYSEAPRKSTDTRHSRPPKTADGSERAYNSHFSWSTVASTAPMAGAMREQTPPPSPPPVPAQYLEPPSYGTPPTQSILSRHRPFKRMEQQEWAPPPRPQQSSFTARSFSPRVYRIQNDYEVSTTPTADGKKRLPLPPLFTEKSMSHLEGLLSQEKSIVLQRRNVERSIMDLEKVEKASPLDVSFTAVREAKKKLEERRGVLDEIRKEEMEIGIRIARARRKEDFGDGEGTLWVRRVTG